MQPLLSARKPLLAAHAASASRSRAVASSSYSTSGFSRREPLNEAERYLAAAEEEAKRLRAVADGFSAASAAARRSRAATQKARLYALRASHETLQVESARELADVRELRENRSDELGSEELARLRSADWTLDALAAFTGASQTVSLSLAELGAAFVAQEIDELASVLDSYPPAGAPLELHAPTEQSAHEAAAGEAPPELHAPTAQPVEAMLRMAELALPALAGAPPAEPHVEAEADYDPFLDTLRGDHSARRRS